MEIPALWSKNDLPEERFAVQIRPIIFIAGIVQMMIAATGYFLYTTGVPAYIYFPKWGPVYLEDQFQMRMWFLVEYLSGMVLLLLSKKDPSKILLTAWMWSAMALSFTSTVTFLWKLPFLKSNDSYLGIVFLIATVNHVTLILIARVHYKSYFFGKDDDEAQKKKNAPLQEIIVTKY